MKVHVITPMNRPENIGPMAELLKERNVEWHVITDEISPHKFVFPNYEWVHHYTCPEHPSNSPIFYDGYNFWNRCNWAMNWFLDTQEVVDDDLYSFLNDDDAVEPDYYKKVIAAMEQHAWQHNVAITSMDRGHRIPSHVTHPARKHPPTKLYGLPENIRPGGIGLEQFVAKGSSIKKLRFPYDNCGDGLFIIELVRTNPTIYVTDAFAWFNYFEPERWDK